MAARATLTGAKLKQGGGPGVPQQGDLESRIPKPAPIQGLAGAGYLGAESSQGASRSACNVFSGAPRSARAHPCLPSPAQLGAPRGHTWAGHTQQLKFKSMPTSLLVCVICPRHPTTDTLFRGAPVGSPALGSAPSRCANEQGNSAAPGPAAKFKTNSSAVRLSGKCAGKKRGTAGRCLNGQAEEAQRLC